MKIYELRSAAPKVFALPYTNMTRPMNYARFQNQTALNFKGSDRDIFIKSTTPDIKAKSTMRNREILNSLTEDFSRLDEVEAVALGGSSAVGRDDSTSDYDIYIYCTKIPSPEKRRAIAEKYADDPEIDNQYFETGDEYTFRETGKPVDIMYRNVDDMEAHVKSVWQEGNAQMGYTTCFVDNINKSEILYDKDGKFRRLQAKTQTPYPEKLRQNIIDKNFTFLKDAASSYYKQIDKASKRGDMVSVNHRSAAFLASYFDVIFAKNRVLNPGEKRLVDFALKNCRILPEDFEKDVNALAVGPVDERAQTASKMVENLRKIL